MTDPATYDIGDGVALTFTVTVADVLTAATVALVVTDPDGSTSNPSVATPSTGVYTAAVAPALAGTWLYKWTATGAATTSEDGWFIVEAPVAADLYASVAELRARFAINDNNDDELLEKAIRAASRGIDDATDRRFFADSTATARVFYPDGRHLVRVDDFWTSDDLVVKTDDDDSGTFGTTWAASDYQLEPLNGVADGHSGWPYNRIRAVGNQWFFCHRRASLQVTAKWGWAAVPAPIRDACLIAAAELYRMKDAPFGIQTGEFGAIRISANPRVAALLAPYMRYPLKVA
jgi:hypothetical protein